MPIRYRKPLGTSGSAVRLEGSFLSVRNRNPAQPTSVHTKNWKRELITIPPLVMKSAIEGETGPAPLDPCDDVMPTAVSVVPALTPSSVGQPLGMSGNAKFHWISDWQNRK